eukprot:3693218-Rhodomonas_salina.1
MGHARQETAASRTLSARGSPWMVLDGGGLTEGAGAVLDAHHRPQPVAWNAHSLCQHRPGIACDGRTRRVLLPAPNDTSVPTNAP